MKWLLNLVGLDGLHCLAIASGTLLPHKNATQEFCYYCGAFVCASDYVFAFECLCKHSKAKPHFIPRHAKDRSGCVVFGKGKKVTSQAG